MCDTQSNSVTLLPHLTFVFWLVSQASCPRNRVLLNFDVLLTVYLRIIISLINQLDAYNFCFTIRLFHASTCFEHMCSKHVEAWNKLIVKQKFCASSWLITEKICIVKFSNNCLKYRAEKFIIYLYFSLFYCGLLYNCLTFKWHEVCL